MSFIGFLLLAICVWFFYNLFVKLIWPVYKTTRHLRQQFKNMAGQSKSAQPEQKPASETPAPKVGEYIEFEEVK